MKKKLLLGLASLTALAVFTSCNDKKADKYTVNVYDIDGEKIGNHKIKVDNDKTFVEQLTKNANLNSKQGQYGTEVISIDNSVVDSNYYMAFYVNGEYSQVGVDLYTPKKGDVVDFKVECWNTVESGYGSLDQTDVLVDKAIYQYVKNYLKEDFTNDTTFSNYFSYIDYNLMGDVAKNYVTLNSELNSYLDTYDLSKLNEDGRNYGKYYYTAKAYNKDLTNYKTQYKAFLDTLTEMPNFAEFYIPFEVCPAKELQISSNIINMVSAVDYAPNTEYGYDGANWWYETLLLLDGFTNETYLENISQADYDNPTSISLSIGSFSASNINPRDSKYEKDGKDLVERLLDSYDEDLGLIKYTEEDTKPVYSTNQIYLGLITYKLQRDNGKAINYFA